MVPQKQNNNEIFLQDRAHCMNAVAQIMEMRATGAVPLAYVQTYGCQQNVADGEKIKGQLAEMGFAFTENPDEADFILYNTCAVRENAESKVFGKVGELKHKKKRKPSLVTALCGCMAEQDHVVERIKKIYPYLDLVFGTHVIHYLPQLLYALLTNGKRIFENGHENEDKQIVEGLPVERDSTQVGAWLTIMYGCNNFCTYCIVPYVRGRERSREPQAIEQEFRQLVKAGYKEIMLLGQNVNSYGQTLENPITFSELLRRLDRIEGDYRIRFMSPHPKDATPELFETMANSKHIAHSLHLPLQAGNNRVLKAMNRNYTREQFLKLVEQARAAMPDITFTTDLIVGFPGETYEEFLDTVDMLEKVKFNSLYTFIYSPRVGTRAASMPDEISAEEKSCWFQELWKKQEEVVAQTSPAMIGTTQRVLVQGYNEKQTMLWGKTEGNMNCEFEGDDSLIGTFVDVKITESPNFVLKGTLITE